MLSYTAIVFTILALSVDAQFSTIGTCSQEIVAASLARIPNSETCGAAVFNLTAAATLNITNDDLAPLLSTVCNPDCGGRFAKFATSCGPIGDNLAYLLTLYCTPNDIVETFCRSQFPMLSIRRCLTVSKPVPHLLPAQRVQLIVLHLSRVPSNK